MASFPGIGGSFDRAKGLVPDGRLATAQWHFDGPHAVLADARIDDRAALIRKLGCAGSIGDAALILLAWRRWGGDCPRHLLGDFAFAVHDRSTGRVFCTRDHTGTRPLHYVLDGERFAFASRIGDLLAAYPDAARLDDAMVALMLVQNTHSPIDRTFYTRIATLPPGHSIEVDADVHRITRWWDPAQVPRLQLARREDYVEAAREVMGRAVRDRIGGNDPLGLHISGGIDSAAVGAFALRDLRAAGRPDPLGFSWHFDAGLVDDDPVSSWTGCMARALGIELLAPLATEAQFENALRADWTRVGDAASLFHEPAIQQAASTRGLTTILSGFGGDEAISFNGRGATAEMLREGRWRALNNLTGTHPLRSLASGVKQGLQELRQPRQPAITRERIERSYLAPGFHELLRGQQYFQPSLGSAQAAMTGVLASGKLTARLEAWHAAGAARGITYHYPLLDRRVMELALSLPPELFRHQGQSRWIMRAALDGLVPDLIRLNPSKYELLRVQHLLSLSDKVMPRLADEIEDRRARLARAHYLDLDRLIRDLRQPAGIGGGHFASRRAALQFLDL